MVEEFTPKPCSGVNALQTQESTNTEYGHLDKELKFQVVTENI